ncbi:hypothetical protein OIDMADRAFT_32736 [Oidiodendron maius Zn]|uniref:DM13 domain-containing protein n=1 Tax=Oidiodendron maius (strain Zn) TaxID=913774 RepID=A0A0C3H099_OIDMZ|nr:hypothetical protein OIDMADRAFT_32736 [Oidiodendron maius Zn]
MIKLSISFLVIGVATFLATAQNATIDKIGWTGTLSSLDGGLGGVVTVTNPTTLTISSYTLQDASAPALYWWGTSNGVLQDGFRISNERVTQAATSDMLTINLDAGKTTVDFNGMGLWCEQLHANFGQATLMAAGASGTSGSSTTTGATPAATTSKSGAVSVGASYGLVAATVMAAVAFATWMG